jgi:hypothetical protein
MEGGYASGRWKFREIFDDWWDSPPNFLDLSSSV